LVLSYHEAATVAGIQARLVAVSKMMAPGGVIMMEIPGAEGFQLAVAAKRVAIEAGIEDTPRGVRKWRQRALAQANLASKLRRTPASFSLQGCRELAFSPGAQDYSTEDITAVAGEIGWVAEWGRGQAAPGARRAWLRKS